MSFYSYGGGFVEGIPVLIQKTDYASLHLTYIEMESPINSGAQCDNDSGIVIMDNDDSSKAALSFAMTALAAGLKFRCYINTNQCSAITGAPATFPVCEYYPTLVK